MLATQQIHGSGGHYTSHIDHSQQCKETSNLTNPILLLIRETHQDTLKIFIGFL